jgi:hypothetical protein
LKKCDDVIKLASKGGCLNECFAVVKEERQPLFLGMLKDDDDKAYCSDDESKKGATSAAASSDAAVDELQSAASTAAVEFTIVFAATTVALFGQQYTM